ncbi:hypothetical protein [Vogesella indigofera]|uniref:hypothetical protein n=1 Tax=Vogesella indigofera TaxID=45465 RepID=UPI00234D1FAE|nr:hypothetical protein [Vogesella indigofera]MDC7704061.1 hypothetical protein [Vogesella indigofera]
MRYRHIVVYQLPGILLSDDGSTGMSIDLHLPQIEARLVRTLDSLPLEVDQADAIGRNILSSFVGQSEPGTPEERIANYVQSVRAARAQAEQGATGVFLMVEKRGDIADFSIEHQHELDAFVFALCDNPSETIKSQSRLQLHGLLSALALASENLSNVKELIDRVIYVRDDGKPIFCYQMSMSASMHALSPLTNEAKVKLTKQARILGRHQALVDVSRLLSKALSAENDPLLSFLSVWSGLEIFVNKNFKEYEETLLSRLADGKPAPVPARVLQRIRSVMSDKYRLSDKFSVIAGELDDSEAENDQPKFDAIKVTRDKLLHGEDVPISSLPTTDATQLLRKYLRLHLERDGA